MQYLDAFNLSVSSLLVINLIPFIYFAYHTKYWYDLARLKRLDFMLAATAIIIASALLVKMIRISDNMNVELFQFAFLHLVFGVSVVLL